MCNKGYMFGEGVEIGSRGIRETFYYLCFIFFFFFEHCGCITYLKFKLKKY